ncbi:MAG: DUF3037 domain-containing protein [Chitinophagaceae bacterium]|nr:MAG: DUF3037 domain-containing protein [Chitinophagaceae bacterium]
MQEQHLFEYAVIRIVPRVEREEFLNVGVIVFCKRPVYLGVRYKLDEEKIKSLFGETDLDCLRDSLSSFHKIADADPAGGPIARLDAPSRFRWLTATRSTMLQTSKVHPGLSRNPSQMLETLFAKLVL